MKIKISLLVVLLTVIIGIGCKKNDNEEPKHCWQIIDQSGMYLYRLCERTETQMKDSFPNPCTYYKLGEEELCWLIDGSMYVPKVPEDYVKSLLKCYNKTSYKEVECGYCQTWYTRQKDTYKPTNTATYSKIRVERLCGDTVKTLYQGRQVVVRETADSLIVLEFSNNGLF